MAGTDDAEDPPVPIPNTAVKLCGAEDTWLETARENRKAPAFSDKKPCGKDYPSRRASFFLLPVSTPPRPLRPFAGAGGFFAVGGDSITHDFA